MKKKLSIIGSMLASATLLAILFLLLRGLPAKATHPATGDAGVTTNEIAEIELSPGCTKVVDPGVVVAYTHVLTNYGARKTISLTHHSSQGWQVMHVPTVALGSLPANTKSFTVSVIVPSDGGGKADVTTITATWENLIGGQSSITATDATVVREPHEIHLPILVRGYRAPIREWSRGGLAGNTVYQIAVCADDPSQLYAGTETGVFRSRDAGFSWQATELQGVRVRGVDVGTADCEQVYAATWGQYVQRSTDRGRSWDTLDDGLPSPYLYTVVVDEQPLFGLYAGTAENGVHQYTSISGSWTWTPIFGQADGLIVARLTPVEPGELLVATWGGNAYRLSFETLTWNATSLEVPEANVFEVVQAGNGDLFAATDNHLYYRADQEWTGVHNQRAYGVAPDPDQAEVVYAATEDGALRSTNGGLRFDPFGLDGVTVRDVAPGPEGSTLLHAGTAEQGAWRRSRP